MYRSVDEDMNVGNVAGGVSVRTGRASPGCEVMKYHAVSE